MAQLIGVKRLGASVAQGQPIKGRDQDDLGQLLFGPGQRSLHQRRCGLASGACGRGVGIKYDGYIYRDLLTYSIALCFESGHYSERVWLDDYELHRVK